MDLSDPDYDLPRVQIREYAIHILNNIESFNYPNQKNNDDKIVLMT